MSTHEIISEYDRARPQVTGVPFFLVPLVKDRKKGKIDPVKLRERLEGRLHEFELDEEDLQRKGNDEKILYVPPVFRDEESKKLALKTSIDEVVLTPSSVFGQATIDKTAILEYRDCRILVIATAEVNFLILHDEKTSRHFLVILGSRANSKSLYGPLNKFLEELRLFALPAQLDPEKIDSIREKLKGELIDTTLDSFPTRKIKMKRIIGLGFQDEESYIRDASISSVHQHMFAFIENAGTERRKRHVVTLSEDGLVRFYSSTTYKSFEWFLRHNILPYLRQIKKPPEAPLMGYTYLEDIFVEEEE